ncbi:nitrilase-related carbon-nitrogen hydrolase [Ornithinimicrobium pekingense]|uniref:Hydrolase n=1 Tax=Ornithinimicrobium pekingense TaxID=384677 RepID=A0ABQ2F7P1_9MICO|nr:nitrilase-related carbon-nitrogen hydrolase [Ornithinimicrobium pekingense]GGK60403.1 hydrolase [Ornithinimicrobium pekingense]
MRIAVGQLRVARDPQENLKRIEDLTVQAAGARARLLLLPEGLISRDAQDPDATRAGAQDPDGPFVSELLEISRRHGMALAGTVHLKHGDKVVNAFLVADRGALAARYDKLHLYDAFNDKESDKVTAGDDYPPVVEIDGVRLGLVTCYDLRFPEHSRHLALNGAQVLLVSAAWVRGSLKEHHWMTLCTARALDNTAYVVASGEISERNVGLSCVVDPMGRVISAAAETEDLIVADLEPQRVADVRAKLPVLANARFAPPTLQPYPTSTPNEKE